MSLFYEHLTMLLIVTGVVTVLYVVIYQPGKSARYLGCGFPLTIVTFCSGFFSLALVPIVLSAISLVCSLQNATRKRGQAWILATSLLLVGGFIGWWLSIISQLNHALQQHPVVSLADRLEYETPARSSIKFETGPLWRVSAPVPEDRSAFEKLLDEGREESADRRRLRTFDSLLRAHRSTYQQFAMATGFGVGRMYPTLPYTSWKIDIPERPLLSLPKAKGNYSTEMELNVTSAQGVDYGPWHMQTQLNFLDPLTLGHVEWDWKSEKPDLTHVVGFRQHGFGSQPKPPATSGDAQNQWQITALSLVSILKHPPGAVYLSDNLPNMSELTDVPTRPLDKFESDALARLREGQELVVQGDSSHLRMLGSIRAAYQCQHCHQVERGTLLGAFTYRLNRLDTASE